MEMNSPNTKDPEMHEESIPMSYTILLLLISVILSILALLATNHIIPKFFDMFIKANLYGIDMCKSGKQKIPEAMGVLSGCIFLITLFLFIPFPFSRFIFHQSRFPHDEFVEFVAAMLSICCMILLGFSDDVLNLRWRHKLFLPTIATLPLLMVYYVNFNSTTIIVPNPLRSWLGYSVDLGVLYYLYMGLLAVFCTNAINIYAGINGIEVGQSLVIAFSIAIFNLIELNGPLAKSHLFSLYFVIPYIGTTLALFKYNAYPSKIFVGDTFCYFSGMTFAVVGILGHFSKTMLLFFIPQILNFILSVPQIFHLLPCPRHRLPKYLSDQDKLTYSVLKYQEKDLNIIGRLIINVFSFLKIVKLKTNNGEDDLYVESNNLTLINYFLVLFGPMHERKLTSLLIAFQVACTLIAFIIRYPLASLFYDVHNSIL